MPTLNDELRDDAVRHSVYVTRYTTRVVKQMLKLIDRVDADIIRRLRAVNLPGARTPYQRRRLEKLLAELRAINTVGYTAMFQALRTELRKVSAYELDFLMRQINAAIVVDVAATAPAAGLVYAATVSRPMQGKYLRQWANQLDANKGRAVSDAVRMGVIEGEAIGQIVSRLRGTRAANYRNGIMSIQKRHAEAVTRTAVNHVTTNARMALINANSDILKGWQYVATLDGRTTDICMSLDGTFYNVGTPGPQPPQHINCRSTIVPVTKSWKEMGINKKELPAGTRASMNGQVSAKETYQTWLKKQPAAFQDDVLGRTKGRLFRKGDVPVSRFVDNSGRSYTLAQLAKTESAAFDAIAVNRRARYLRDPEDGDGG